MFSWDVDMERKLFDEMLVRYTVIHNSMILGYTSRGMWGEASEILEFFLQSIQANTLTWNIVVFGYMHMSKHMEVLRLTSRMAASGSAPDSIIILISLNVCSMIHSLRLGMEIYAMTIHMNYSEL